MTLETERLILRPWREDDAAALYRYACHPDVGPRAGWPAHTSPADSLAAIRGPLAADGTFAVVLKQTSQPVGSIALRRGGAGRPDSEAEIGYWIGVPYWGQGLIPEAVRALLRYGFDTLQLERIWCAYFDGNSNSRRVQAKCGFRYHHSVAKVPCAIEGVYRTRHVTCITRDDWLHLPDGQR